MGEIRSNVRLEYLSKYPEDESILKPFLNGFYITWATIRHAYNTEIKVFFLSPETHMKETYGFENELLLVYAPYPRMEPRTIQAIEQIFAESPAKGRVETLNYFLISDAHNVRDWLNEYTSSRQESRIIVSFTKDELIASKGDAWFIRNRLHEQFFGRDLFNYSLPLVEDTYFFGRQQLIMEYLDTIKRKENKAIFGLRKTGKTSFLFKLERLILKENIAKTVYIDCKLPDIRKSHWNELLEEIAEKLSKSFNIPMEGDFSDKKASKSFFVIIERIKNKNGNICLFFDEIEFISFVSKLNLHWHSEFIDFWQTLWSCQSQLKNFSFIIAGVNPSVIETDTVNGVQNPLFGIVPHKYLTGFNEEEVKIMLKTLGKRMGMQFSHAAIKKIFEWYGGHPLLTRLCCSWLNTILSEVGGKPIEITDQIFEKQKNSCDEELVFYCGHVVSELKEFYEFEYYVFELLSSGQLLDVKEIGDKNFKHLFDYGILQKTKNNFVISIPVISKYVGLELAKSEGRSLVYKIIEPERREAWLNRRREEIIIDMRALERIINLYNLPKIFGDTSFPEADEFLNIKVVTSVQSFSSFINTCYRCFIEPIDSYGTLINKNSYFWNEIMNNYNDLFDALHRIRVYRNERDHIKLNDSVNQQFISFRKIDLEDHVPSQVQDLFFTLQQRVLDALLRGIHFEIAKIS